MHFKMKKHLLNFFSTFSFLFVAITEPLSAEPQNSIAQATSKTVPASEVTPVVDSLDELFKQGRAYLNFRYRYENVDQDSIAKNANASTLRSRLGFESAQYKAFKGAIEIEDVRQLGNDLYNDTLNGKTSYPIVADPESTEVNQAYLSYAGMPDTLAKGGRRILNLDDERFVGEVGWRQNNQTYDGIDVNNTSIPDTNLFYSWNYQINRVFGEDSPNGTYNSQAHFVNVKNKSIAGVDITVFSYLLDLENAVQSSTSTYGLRVNGKTAVGAGLDWLYDTSYAYQADYADNPSDYSVNYYHVATGFGVKTVQVLLGYEVLGSSDGEVAFQTLLATLHKFNGWADLFLSTPNTGLEDLYLKLPGNLEGLGACFGGVTFELAAHDFRSYEDGQHYGTEWDAMLQKALTADTSVALNYAYYNAIEYASDTTKVWLSLSTKFST